MVRGNLQRSWDIVKDLPTKDLAGAFAFEKYIDVEP